ncbi:MAG TPA: DUF2231 domain-containing protein [Kribbella sp.]|nr:DUF2231 domain-containing protein [Kribbella sp.]
MGVVGTHGQHRAKHPRSVIAGPYGHPYHPVMVTVPIGAWVASVVFDIVALAGNADAAAFREGAYWLIAIGVVGAVLAAFFGILDLLTIPPGTKAFRTAVTHMSINLVVVVLFVVNFALRASQGYERRNVVAFVLSVIGVALLGASGWLGGKLAYRYGVRVASEETQSEGFT